MSYFKEYGIYLILIALGVFGLVASGGWTFGEYLSLYIFKPALKMTMVFLIIEFSFRKIEFQNEVLKGNIAAAIIFLGICLVVAEAI